ncbi:MAG: hypothetical protein U9N57_01165 [Pseudomonadota bacterium]|nr:hypothetical protein [Pseudomonadota bacterium]
MSRKPYPKLNRKEIDRILTSAPHSFSEEDIEFSKQFLSDGKEMTELTEERGISTAMGYKRLRKFWEFIEENSKHSMRKIYRPVNVRVVAKGNPKKCVVIPVPTRSLSNVIFKVRRLLAG